MADDVTRSTIDAAERRATEPGRVEPAAGVRGRRRDLTDDSLVNAKSSLADALDELVGVLRSPDAVGSIADVDRANLAKYLTIAKLRLENAIAIVRSGDDPATDGSRVTTP